MNPGQKPIDLTAARQEAERLLQLLKGQQTQVASALRRAGRPELKAVDQFVRTLIRLINYEVRVLSYDADALVEYQKPSVTSFELQNKFCALGSSFGIKAPLPFRVYEGLKYLQDHSLDAYQHHSACAALRVQLETVLEQFPTQAGLYRLQFRAVQELFEAYRIREITLAPVYRLPTAIDLNAFQQTTMNVVMISRPVHELAEFVLPINAAMVAQLAQPDADNSK
jgi:hypothetical protein